MKLTVEYLKHAHRFEQLAAAQKNPEAKTKLEHEANEFRDLAFWRTRRLGLPLSGDPPTEATRETDWCAIATLAREYAGAAGAVRTQFPST
jgi:hypothetical protein